MLALSFKLVKSATWALEFEIDDPPNTKPKNLQTKSVWTFCDTADPTLKQVKSIEDKIKVFFRPIVSDSGPRKTGPRPNPRTANEIPAAVTTERKEI